MDPVKRLPEISPRSKNFEWMKSLAIAFMIEISMKSLELYVLKLDFLKASIETGINFNFELVQRTLDKCHH